MVVGAIENVFAAVCHEGGGKIDRFQSRLRIGAIDHRLLIVVRSTVRQDVRIKLCRRGDQGERDRNTGVRE